MTLDEFRNNANNSLKAAQDSVLNNRSPYDDVLRQAPIAIQETNLASRIRTLQQIEKDGIATLSTISEAVRTMQEYQTAAINPAGLGDNGPTGETSS